MQPPVFPVARPSSARLPPGIFALPFGVLVLLAGLWGGLARLDIAVPNAANTFAQHGFLMSIGFLGTLISTERAVALARWWAWGVPALSIIGSAWLIFGDSPQIGYAFFFVAGLDLVVVYARLHQIQASTHNTFMGLAAVGWAVAAAIGMTGYSVAHTVPWLAIFLVVTITAERLELSRMLKRTRPVRIALVVALVVTFAGAILAFFFRDMGWRVTGLGMAGMAVWLMIYDLARRTIRAKAVTRFMAAGLLSGYVWLAAGGLLWAIAGEQIANPRYDAASYNPFYDAQLHIVFLGFVMSMVFAHAPVIAPAVIRKPLPYFPIFYGPLALLHAALLLRIVAGDALGVRWAWQIGGILNEVALIAFVMVNVGAFLRASVVTKRERAAHMAARAATAAPHPPSSGESMPASEPLASTASADAPPPKRGLGSTIAGSVIGVAILVAAVIYANSGGGSTTGTDGASSAGSAAPAVDSADVITAEQAAAGVEISLVEMRVVPSRIVVEPGAKLVLKVTNNGTMRHDLKIETGAMTSVLDPGQSETLDVGVVSGALSGWCTLPGHRSAGMTMAIDVASADGSAPSSGGASSAAGGDMSGMNHVGDAAAALGADPSPGWKPIDASIPPAADTTVHEITWNIRDIATEVAPDVTQVMWTFDEQVPGPVLRGKVGDRFEITVVNDTEMTHNIDFHAESGPPAKVMTPIDPGATHTYTFEATHAGAWLYHCGIEPMLLHMGNGMYGALIIDPPDLPPADSEFVLVGSELFFGAPDDDANYAKMAANTPDAVVFNGYPFAYHHQPLAARVGELVRIWVVNAGPSRSVAFHVIGAPFTTQYLNGAYLLKDGMSAGVESGGAQTLPVDPGNGGFVELRFADTGDYPFVSHVMADSILGAMGTFAVTE